LKAPAGAALFLIDIYARNVERDLIDTEKQEIRKLTATLDAAP
jgi:hypothetical protein